MSGYFEIGYEPLEDCFVVKRCGERMVAIESWIVASLAADFNIPPIEAVKILLGEMMFYYFDNNDGVAQKWTCKQIF